MIPYAALMFLSFSIGWGSVPAAADSEETAKANATEKDEEGLWPSPKLMRLMLARWAEDISEQYDLDDEQRGQVRKMVTRRWEKFLEENRETIRPLMNEFLELRMELEPPPKEKVQDWAKRAQPMFEEFRKQIDEGTSEFREVLRPMQRVKFEVDAIQFGVGMSFVEKQLRDYQSGEFEPEEFWLPHGERFRRERGERRRKDREEFAQAVQEAQSEAKSPDQIELELTRWEEYVAAFIQAHGLDEGQRTTVLSVLNELRGRAKDHRDRRREEIDDLERRIADGSPGESERQELKDRLVELYGPIDEMFRELQRRTDAVLTAEQRAKAAAASKTRDRPGEVPPPKEQVPPS